MTKTKRLLLASTALALAMAGGVTSAHADCIPISSVPYKISQSGSYCITADLSLALSTGEAIAVLVSDVDIDFQGYTITNTTPSAGTAGVHLMSSGPVNNVTIHNGTLYSFDTGINGVPINGGIQAYNLAVDHMTIKFSKSYGIHLLGANLRVTNNTIYFVTGGADITGVSATGIALSGDSVSYMTASNRAVVQGNNVSVVKVSGKNPDGTVARTASATGIYVGYFPDILIRDNVVYGISSPITSPVWSSTTYSRAVGIGVGQMVEPYRIGGLIIQDNTVMNNAIYIKNTNPNSLGIEVNYPGDHAIVTGSNITGMTTGIETGWASLPGTPPILLLNNTITGATTPINGGPINGAVTLPQ